MINAGKVQFRLYVPAKSSRHIKTRAAEFAKYLSKIAGTGISVVNKLPADKKITVLRFGDSDFAKANKIAPDTIDRDGFVIASFGNQILLVGRDSLRDGEGEGTFYGALDFLERFGGARFYFPGKYGTLLPRKKVWQVPSMTVYDRPDSQHREIYWGDPKWHDPSIDRRKAMDAHKRELRFSTLSLPNCHTLANLGYVQRFAKTHREYFATQLDGKIADGSTWRNPCDNRGHLCFSSGIMEEIYQDAKAILTGPEAVKKRNMTGAPRWLTGKKPFFSMLPNDCMVRCRCKKCAPHYEGLGISTGYSEKAADFTWERMLYVPRRLKKENVPGTVIILAYDLCREVPKQDIPDNVMLQVAVLGPWAKQDKERWTKDERFVQRWCKKMGGRIFMWNYVTKHTLRGAPDIPNSTPRTIAEYYRSVNKYSFGAFLESGTDYWIFSHLNNYIFSKIMWDNNADTDALLAEYHKLMFGSGAAPMQEINDSIERHWINDIVGKTIITSYGPVLRPPSEYKLLNVIYSPKEMKRINGLFDKAEKLAAKEIDQLARIKFIRKAFWGPLNSLSVDYFKKAAAVDKWQADAGTLKSVEKIVIDGTGNEKAWKDAPSVALIPLNSNKAEVLTFVKMLHDKENLYFLFDCREPLTGRMTGKTRKSDDPEMWSDNSVEIHLDPTGSRKEKFQFMIDRFGGLTDLHFIDKTQKFNIKWNSGAEVKTSVVPGKSWFAEVRIPLKSMSKANNNFIAANFTRHRVIEGVKVHPYYVWSPHVKSFGDQHHFGLIHLGIRADDNMLSDGDFINFGFYSPKSLWRYGRPVPKRDTECFRTAGVSIRLEGHRCGVYHAIKNLKPNTTYSLSFFIRQENVKLNKGASPLGGGFFVRIDDKNGVVRRYPKRAFFGTIPWTRWEYIYRTSDKKPGESPYLHFVLRSSTGKVWIDNVKLVELPGKK